MDSSHQVKVVRIAGALFAEVSDQFGTRCFVRPLALICNPDTLGAANNPEEFVMPREGDDISEFYAVYLGINRRLPSK